MEKREAGPAACPTPVPVSASRQLSMQGGYTRGKGAVGRKSSRASCMPNAGARVGFQAAEDAGGAKAGEEKKVGGPGCMPNAGARVGFHAAEHAGVVYERERCSGKDNVA